MAFIGNREKNFQKYLENHFGLKLPEGVALFYVRGVRVGATGLNKSHIHGELGYAACDFGFNPTHALIQNFGHLATKNRVKVNEAEAREFAAGRAISAGLGIKAKYVIVRYGEHTLGLGYYDPGQRRVLNKIPEKRRREIINTL